MTGIVVLIAVLVGLTTLALWLEHSRADVWSWLYGTTDPRELVDRAREREPVARIDWSRMHHGICPKCREDKFIGHGPLCIDCLGGAA